jgi:hypothetical protein
MAIINSKILRVITVTILTAALVIGLPVAIGTYHNAADGIVAKALDTNAYAANKKKITLNKTLYKRAGKSSAAIIKKTGKLKFVQRIVLNQTVEFKKNGITYFFRPEEPFQWEDAPYVLDGTEKCVAIEAPMKKVLKNFKKMKASTVLKKCGAKKIKFRSFDNYGEGKYENLFIFTAKGLIWEFGSNPYITNGKLSKKKALKRYVKAKELVIIVKNPNSFPNPNPWDMV